MTEEKENSRGLRFNEGKLRVDLVPTSAIIGIANGLTIGLTKYPERNWEHGMKWTTVTASLERHFLDFKSGMDYDPDDGVLLIDKVLTNAAFIKEYYSTYLQGDDRPHKYLQPKVRGLDVDDVLGDWLGHWTSKFNSPRPTAWNFDRYIAEKFEFMKKDKDFWLTIPVKTRPEDIPFEPDCYISSRSIPKEWTEEWLDKNGFPVAPVEIVGHGVSKVDAAKKHNVEVFVDDNYKNFVDLNRAGILCYLFDAPHNQRYDVGFKRIKSLKEMV